MQRQTLIRVVLLILLVLVSAWVLMRFGRLDAAQIEAWIKGFGMAAPLVFMSVYALGTVFFLPGAVLTIAGGALFGPVWGSLYNLTAATAGATLAFLVARYFAAEWAERRAGGRLRQIKQGVEAEGWRFVALARLVPLFPFVLLNYALGLTRIRLWHYVLTSYVCMLPGTVAYTYLGYVGREAATGGQDLAQKGLLALALLALTAFLPRLLRRLRRAEPGGRG